jgi:hypothetical protein
MTLTKSFKELVQGRTARKPEFATALLREGADTSYRSPLMAPIRETAEGLHTAGVMDKQTMRKFDEARLTAMHSRDPTPGKT